MSEKEVDYKSGTYWSALEANHQIYNNLRDSIRNTTLAINNMENIQVQVKELNSNLYAFYISNMGLFNSYLIKKFKDAKNKISPQNYKELSRKQVSINQETIHHLFYLSEIIIEWAQIEGPFATINEKRDPREAW